MSGIVPKSKSQLHQAIILGQVVTYIDLNVVGVNNKGYIRTEKCKPNKFFKPWLPAITIK